MKLKDVFEKTVQFFKEKKIETARLDAELIISHALKIERLQIYLKYEQPMSEAELSLCRELVRRRSQGEPVAYILEEKGFYGEVFTVGPGVLIPRPESELVVEQALAFVKEKKNNEDSNKKSIRLLDLGAGSGCIGFAILKNLLKDRLQASLVSVEKSPQAFAYLQKNQHKLDLKSHSELRQSDVLSLQESQETYDIIVANPPYIAADDPLVEANVRKFEPETALFSAAQGFADIKAWSEISVNQLKSPGLMLFEIGQSQGVQAATHFRRLPGLKKAEILKDLSGLDRVIRAEK